MDSAHFSLESQVRVAERKADITQDKGGFMCSEGNYVLNFEYLLFVIVRLRPGTSYTKHCFFCAVKFTCLLGGGGEGFA